MSAATARKPAADSAMVADALWGFRNWRATLTFRNLDVLREEDL